MVNLGKRITDFSTGASIDQEGERLVSDEEKEGEMDVDMGVAVVFDEEEEELGDSDVDEVCLYVRTSRNILFHISV